MKIVTVGEAKEFLEKTLQDYLPVFLWGPPGIGKSSIVKQICEEKKWKMVDIRLSTVNPVDLRGLPVVDREKGQAIWLRPEFFPDPNSKEEGVIFFDELNTAAASVQIASYQLILDRQLGSYKLPAGYKIIAAGNRETDKANVTKLPAPLANRLIHLELQTDHKQWITWAIKAKIDQRIINFIQFKPDLLSTTPKGDEKAFPTPRSWEFVSRIVKLFDDIEDSKALVAGAIGEGAMSEFFAWLPSYASLPDVMEILAGKSNKVPKRADLLSALVTGLISNLDDSNLENFLNYTFLLPGEHAVLAVQQAIEGGWVGKLQKLGKWDEWADKFYDLIPAPL